MEISFKLNVKDHIILVFIAYTNKLTHFPKKTLPFPRGRS